MISYSSFPVAAAEASVAFGGLFRRRRFQSPAEHLTSPEGIHRLLVAISTRLTEYSDGEEGWKGGGGGGGGEGFCYFGSRHQEVSFNCVTLGNFWCVCRLLARLP